MSSEFNLIAREIGHRLCREAFWHEHYCNWIDKSLNDLIYNGVLAKKSLSPDIYDGTSGIALFLTNLYLVEKDEEFKRCAKGAIMQALYKARKGNTLPSGLYTGKMGIAYAASIIGDRLGDNELIEESIEIVRNLELSHDMLDLISGIAGAILSLLKVYDISQESDILDIAIGMGDRLVELAIKEDYGWSWDYRASGMDAIRNLTGFSHGAAGIAYALLELYNISRKERFLEGAIQAFRYENHWFDEKELNWPDFRVDMDNKSVGFSFGWCHGAPGISISRLRMLQITDDKRYMVDIDNSINMIRRVIKDLKEGDNINFSLCHGLAGIGDILIYASKIIDKDLLSLAREIGYYGIRHFVDNRLPWPSDNRIGELLGLMLGIAGIGNFYLRLDNDVSSILMPHL